MRTTQPGTHRLGRRAFLSAAGAAAATALASCTSSSAPPSPPPATGEPTTAPTTSVAAGTASPRSSATASPPDWPALRGALRGTLLLPADAGYDRARILYNTRFDGVRPQAVARCATTADVGECVLFARRHALPLAIRSGGHSYGGFSTGTGLVVDLRAMSAIEIAAGTVRVGAGAQLIDIYAALADKGAGIPAGSCPTVGISGLTLAGGLGVLARAWGLTCDTLTEAEIVTADGTVRICDERREPDLFWAMRGGGAGSFGIATSFVLRTRPITRLSLAFVQWDPARAREVLSAWQEWIARAPDELWSNVHLNAGPAPEVAVHATFLGEQSQLGNAIDRLVQASGAAPTYREVGSLPYADAMLLEAGCLGRSVAQCHLKGDTTAGALERETYVGTSVVAERALSGAALDALAATLSRERPPNGLSGAVIIDALGGAVARIAPGATAFPHRSALATIQLLSSWSASAPSAVADAGRAWSRSRRGDLRAAIGPGAYSGYADADLPDWPSAYYGSNYARLQQIKARYDPDGFFAFPQSIR